MALANDDALGRRLEEYLYDKIGSHLGRREQKESFALYGYGIVGDGESVEPIAARATGDAEECERMQARLLNFLRDRTSATRRKLKDRQAVDRCAKYMHGLAPYMRYGAALRDGLPIATGVIEGACRHLIRRRLDIGARAGARKELKPFSCSGPSSRPGTSTSTGRFTSHSCFDALTRQSTVVAFRARAPRSDG